MIPTDPSSPPSKKTTLCIDDDASILGYEKALLERSGYEVLTAPSATGPQAGDDMPVPMPSSSTTSCTG